MFLFFLGQKAWWLWLRLHGSTTTSTTGLGSCRCWRSIVFLPLWCSRALGLVRRIVVLRFLSLQIILSDVFAEIRKRIVVVTSATALFLPHRRDR